MDTPTRRGFLAATGASLVGAAGCLSVPQDESSADSFANPSSSSLDRYATQSDGVYAEVYRDAIESVALLQVAGEAAAEGSAFVYDDRHLVTNQHVVDGAGRIDVQYATGEWTSGTVVGEDIYSDLAVVRFDDRPATATPLPLAGEPPTIGQEVLALGNPLGFDSSVSQGIVSGVNRSLPAPTDFSIPNAVQIDAALNPGNSGGPVLNLDTEVVAVVTAGTGEGIGFGISSALTQRVVPALIDDGEFEHSYMGISLVDVTPRVAERNDLPEVSGVIIGDVQDGMPADEAGLQGSSDIEEVDGRQVPIGGDVIVALDDHEIIQSEDLSTYLALETNPGDTIDVTVVRDGETQVLPLTLTARDS